MNYQHITNAFEGTNAVPDSWRLHLALVLNGFVYREIGYNVSKSEIHLSIAESMVASFNLWVLSLLFEDTSHECTIIGAMLGTRSTVARINFNCGNSPTLDFSLEYSGVSYLVPCRVLLEF